MVVTYLSLVTCLHSVTEEPYEVQKEIKEHQDQRNPLEKLEEAAVAVESESRIGSPILSLLYIKMS